jgi:hypothetical protein
MRRVVLASIVGGMLATSSRAAHAEPTDEQRALASSLFDEGKSLMASGKVPDGCRKLEESERLVRLPGTLLNLAVCHELEGKLASAMGEFREARDLAVRDHREDRAALADQHLAAIAPHVSKLVVVVGANADVPGLRIDCDGTSIGRAVWGSPVPIDAGERHITVSAPNKEEHTLVVVVGRDGDVQRIVIAPLAAASKPLAPLSMRALSEEAPRATKFRLTGRRIAALLLGSSGVVSLGVGTGFGVHAISEHSDPNNTCTMIPCEPKSVAANDDARRASNAATLSFGIGLVAIAASAVLWLVTK